MPSTASSTFPSTPEARCSPTRFRRNRAMRKIRIKRNQGALAAVVLSLFVASALVAAQGKGKAIPRTSDGRPDMQGYWTNQTFTPLERPAELKGKEFFTTEEA